MSDKDELFIIRARNPRPGDAPAICYRFTEAGAAAEIERLRAGGREAYTERGTVRCGWGAAYESTHCHNNATMVQIGDYCTSYMCDVHAARRVRDCNSVFNCSAFHSFSECAEIESQTKQPNNAIRGTSKQGGFFDETE